MNPLTIDKQFFAALIAGDAQALDHILVDDRNSWAQSLERELN